MEALRTPDDRFGDLPGFSFAPHYVAVPDGDGGTLRVHYLDEGPADGEVVVLLHGEPSWSYLYRKMIPVLTGAGLRCIAPDLVGFGRSDKPAQREDYTYGRHVEWTRCVLFDALGLSGVTLVGQDWGGLIGLRLVAEHPDQFVRVVAANTGLPTGDEPLTDAFFAWQRYARDVAEMPIGAIVRGGCVKGLPDDVVAAYDAPFPDESFKEGARQFPSLVPSSPDDPAAPANRRAWETLFRFERPFLVAFSDSDPITKGGDRVLRERIHGARGRAHATIQGAGHFLQEDRGEELAAIVARFVAETPG